MKDWDAATALSVALDAADRHGRTAALAEWVGGDGDFLAQAEDAGWTDEQAIAAVLAFAEDVGFTRQLDAHARRVARRQPPDPDHYGT